jgi:hypothetical protein
MDLFSYTAEVSWSTVDSAVFDITPQIKKTDLESFQRRVAKKQADFGILNLLIVLSSKLSNFEIKNSAEHAPVQPGILIFNNKIQVMGLG